MDELITEAKPENTDAVLDFISGRITGCPAKIRNHICIAADEIFSNISRYAYSPGTGAAVVRVAAGDIITVEFEDGGAAYNPLAAGEPDTALPPENREVGGLGLFLVKKLMDTVEYRREGGRNILTVRKRASV